MAQPGAETSPLLKTALQGQSLLTPFYEVLFEGQGGLAALADRRTGRPLLQPGHRHGFYAATLDGEERESQGRWLLPVVARDDPSVTAREDGFIGSIPYTSELTFHAGTPRLDCRVKFHFTGQKLGRVSTNQREATSPFVHEQKLRFKLFPAAGASAVGVRDVPFGVSETTNRYVQGNYWTALTDRQTGVAIFNRGTMGRARESDGGFSVPLAYAM